MSTSIKIRPGLGTADGGEAIPFSRAIGRLYGKKQYQNQPIIIAGTQLYTGDKIETPLIPGRTKPESGVPAFSAEGLDQLLATAHTGPDASFQGIIVGDTMGHVAAITEAAEGYASACTCGAPYACSTQFAALFTMLAHTAPGVAEFNRADQLRNMLEVLLATDPASRSVEQVILLADAGYLTMNEPELRNDTFIQFQVPELGLQLVNELRRLNIVDMETIGPRALPTHALGAWTREAQRPVLASLDAVDALASLVAAAHARGMSPAAMLLDDD